MLPHFLQDKVPAMLGCEAGLLSPNQEELEEQGLSSGMKKRNRRSFGGKSPDPTFLLLLEPKRSTAGSEQIIELELLSKTV